MQKKQMCCIEPCLSNSLRIKNITFHAVPTHRPTFDIWCKTIRRKVIGFVPKPDMEVCSIHFHRNAFKPDGELKSSATPMYFPILHDVRCCVQGCYSRKSNNQVFQRFPKDDDVCAKWMEVIQSHNGHPVSQHAAYVCSLHFANDSTSIETSVPTIFPPKPSYCVSSVGTTTTTPLTSENRLVTTLTKTATITSTDKPSDAKKMKPVDEIIILDDEDDDETSVEPIQSTSNEKNSQQAGGDKMRMRNLPMRLLQRIQQLKNENAKAEREVNVMKRKYLELKKRCDALDAPM